MRRVIFPYVKSGTTVVYPDNIEYFSSTEVVGSDMTADYTGSDENIQTHYTVDVIEAHVTIVAGTESIPKILNDGVDAAVMTIVCRLPNGDLAPMEDKDYTILMSGSGGNTYDLVSVPFVGATATFNYTSDMNPDTIHVDVEDLYMDGYDGVFEIAGDNQLRIYRELS